MAFVVSASWASKSAAGMPAKRRERRCMQTEFTLLDVIWLAGLLLARVDVLQIHHIEHGADEFSIKLMEEGHGLRVDLLDDMAGGEDGNNAVHVLCELFGIREI